MYEQFNDGNMNLGLDIYKNHEPFGLHGQNVMLVVNADLAVCSNDFSVKIKNIEQTEEAKQKLIDEKNKKKNKVSDFVPTNYAVNFVQHNRCELKCV